MLKLYTDMKCTEDGDRYLPFLYPFFGKQRQKNPLLETAFDDWIRDGKRYAVLVDSPRDCDYVIFPNDAVYLNDFRERFEELRRIADVHGKKLVCFHMGDFGNKFHGENMIIFKTSLYSFEKKPNEFAIPYYTNDILSEIQSTMVYRQKQNVPVVGFCGWAELKKIKTKVYMMLQNASINALSLLRGDIYRSKKKGIFFRKKVIDILSRTGWIKTNFIVRNEYFAGELNTKLSSSFGSVREEYVNNLLNSDYALCVKGDGNYSIRFSEALCAGRIPLLIDTACVLPFDDLIKYKSFLPIVDFQDIETTSERLRDFHEKLSSEEFVELQNKARQLWEAHLSPHGMFKTICNILEKRVHKI